MRLGFPTEWDGWQGRVESGASRGIVAAKKRRAALGRGLDALLNLPDSEGQSTSGSVQELGIDLLRRGRFQPRQHFDEQSLKLLAESIRGQGLVQPILVRPIAGRGEYEIIAGERRWRAAQRAGLNKVPVLVREVDDQAVMCMALIENIQREELNALEEAEGLSRLIDEFGMSHEAAAKAVGRSRPAVSNLLRLLELQSGVKSMLIDGKLGEGHARALLGLRGAAQLRVARQVAKHAMTVRAAEQLVKSEQGGGKAKPGGRAGTRRPIQDPNIRKLQDELGNRLGAPVTIHSRPNGQGKIQIQYHSLDELDGILQRLAPPRGKKAGGRRAAKPR